MRPNLTVITLGVRDLERSMHFYQKGLGWRTASTLKEGVAFFSLNGVILALFPKMELAKDATVSAKGSGFSGVALAHNTRSRNEVDIVLRKARSCGAKIVKKAGKAFWGGYTGYFSDPDGYLWEVAYNPYWKLDRQGRVVLP